MNSSSVYATLGLSRNPFPPTPDAGSYFFTRQLEEDFVEIQHCIEARKGCVLLTGEVGLGKSTMVRRLLNALLDKDCKSALILNTFLQEDALLAAIQMDFGLESSASTEQGFARLTEFLLSRHHAGKTALLVIDDAQNLSVASLELIRLLCNLETDQEKLLQILLVGQPELESLLAQPQLRQLKSRIVKHARLSPMQKSEFGRYFDFRVNAANAQGRLSIDSAAVKHLHRATGGNLRQMHLVLDRCLYGLAHARTSVVTAALVQRAISELPKIERVQGRTLPQRGYWIGAGAACAVMGVAAAFIPANGDMLPMGMQAIALPQELQDRLEQQTALEAQAIPGRGQAFQESAEGTVPAPAAAVATTHYRAFSSEAATPSRCHKKLEEISVAGEVINMHTLLPAAKRPWEAFPAARWCLFSMEGQAWIAWLDRNEIVHPGVAHERTRTVQARLKRLGLLDPQEPEDGVFGPKTKEAFTRFQKQQGLDPQGTPDTLAILVLETQDASAH